MYERLKKWNVKIFFSGRYSVYRGLLLRIHEFVNVQSASELCDYIQALDVAASAARESFNMNAIAYSAFIFKIAISNGYPEKEALKIAMEIANEK